MAVAEDGTIRDETGSQRLLGYVIHVGPEPGQARVTMEVHDDHLNRQDVLHGGFSAALMDTAMGAAASSTVSLDASARFSTVSLTVQFLAPGRAGPIEAVARRVGGGSRTLFIDATLRQVETGVVIATATGVFQRARPKDNA